MRKWLYWGALAAVVMLPTSCIREKNFETYAPEPEAISFVISGYTTRSESVAKLEDEVRVNRYSLGTDDHGNLFTLEETVTRMDDWGDAPATRGTPAYSENVQDVHGSSFRGILYNPTTGALVADDTFKAMEDGVRWRCEFGFNPWEQANPMTFFLSMPFEASGLSNIAYHRDNGKFSFDYETPGTAEDQQDILFASRMLQEDTYTNEQRSNGGASVLFRHALTGVKFNIGNNDTDETTGTQPENQVETFITKVEFIGLKSKGSAVFSPSGNETTQDDRTEFTSKNSFVWSLDNTSTDMVFSQEFTENDIQDFSLVSVTDPETGETQSEETGSVHGAPSFYAAGNLRNLNTENASLTFWFIPQDITADLKLRVTFYVWNGVSQGEEITRVLDLGARIIAQSSMTNKRWDAGELRTFKLTPSSVDVDITADFDEVDANILSTPEIRNTGNKEAYLRVAIVGNWVDSSTGEIVTRYWNTGVDPEVWTAISPWTESDGTFSPALTPNAGNWRKVGDFWYYTSSVPAGKRPGETAEGGLYEPLFESYAKPASPTDDVELMLDLAVQAVDASAGASYTEAWTAVGAM